MKTRIPIWMLLLLLAAAAAAQPTLRLDFYDPGKSPVGPYTQLRIGEIGTAYVVVGNAEMTLGGASFRLAPFPVSGVQPLNQHFPPGVVIGDLWSGVEIGLASPIPMYGGDEAVIAWFDFLATELTVREILPVAHPGNTAPLVAHAGGPLEEAQGIPGMIEVVLRPTLGLYFDAAGTSQTGSFVGGPDEYRDVWLLIQDLDRPIDALYFTLDLPPSMEVVDTVLPTGAVLDGDLTTGAVISYTPRLEAPGFTPVEMARFTVRLGPEPLFDARLAVTSYDAPGVGSPFVAIFPAQAYRAISLPATITLPIGAEKRTMSEVKALFR